MKIQKKELCIKSFLYILMSYAVAIITIAIQWYFSRHDSNSQIMLNIFNILLSTNACFIMTTTYGIGKNCSDDYGLIKVCQGVGVLICAVLMATTILSDEYIANYYYIGSFISLLCSLYLTYKYICDTIKSSQIVADFEQKDFMEKAEKAKLQEEFSMSGVVYKI